MMPRKTIATVLCVASSTFFAGQIVADEALPPLATTSVVAKRPVEPQPTLTPRETPLEFFVDGTAASASDDNPGTDGSPFKTINRGMTELKPGDTLTVRAGTYREFLRVKVIASAEHPVVLRAAEGQTVVIKGSELVKGWVKDGNVWKKEGWTKDFVQKEFAKGAGASADVMQVYQKDGVRGEAVVLFRVRTVEELRAGKCYWDETTGTITIYPAAGHDAFDPNRDGIEVPVRNAGLSVDGRHITARGFQVRQVTGGNGIGGWHNRMEDCVFTWSGNNGCHVTGFYTTLQRCETSYCGCTGMGGVGEEILIEDCVLTDNNIWRYNPGWHGGGAKFIPGFSKSVVRGCRFERNYGPGLWFDASCNDNLIENNNCSDNEGCGIAVEISRGNLLRNNICNGNRAPLPGVDIVPTDRGIHPVNCQQLRQEGGRGGTGIVISSSPYSKVYNNLCYGNQGEGIDVEGNRRSSEDMTDYSTGEREEVWFSSHNVDIRNNILINNGGQALRMARSGRDADTFNNRSDYNIFYSADNRPLVRWGFGGTVFQTLEQWQKESSNDLHSVLGAPMFEFAPGLNFRLQPDSLGVDQGQSIPDVPVDMLGFPRPAGQADIGPYEIASMQRKVDKPKMPENLTYFQVDLDGLINRTFADDEKADGVGGWTDQGPDCDLATFPTGRQTFHGVPFDVSPKGCVVLHGNPWSYKKETLPVRVVIPVHRKADVLVFLHSGAWVWNGRCDWTYIIHRADGTQVEIKMIGGENIRDWANPNGSVPFHREYPTTSREAWSGANKTFERVSVYMMTWVNTSTWCDVTEVEMISSDCSVPVLIGLTGGVEP